MSVDRNNQIAGQLCKVDCVALRKESVDRNNKMWGKTISRAMSLSARRAWIEIFSCALLLLALVALRKESVDRNAYISLLQTFDIGRSPQGERG